MSNDPATEPSICVIALDETEHWAENLPANFAAVIERIETVYYYDEHVLVRAAEITPSYELYRWHTRAVTRDGTDDNLRDQIDNYIIEGAADDDWVIYMHSGRIDALVAKNSDLKHPSNDWTFRRIGKVDPELAQMSYEQRMDALLHDFNSNSPL